MKRKIHRPKYYRYGEFMPAETALPSWLPPKHFVGPQKPRPAVIYFRRYEPLPEKLQKETTP